MTEKVKKANKTPSSTPKPSNRKKAPKNDLNNHSELPSVNADKSTLQTSSKNIMEQLLEDFLNNPSEELLKLLDEKKISVDEKLLLHNLLNCLIKSEFIPSRKIDLSILSSKNAEQVISKSENFYLLLEEYSQSKSTKTVKRIKAIILRDSESFGRFSKAFSKLPTTFRKLLVIELEDIFNSSSYKKSPVSMQLRAISFFSSQGVNPIKQLSALENISIEFNEFDENTQFSMIQALKFWDITAVFQLLCHVDGDRIRYSLVEKLVRDLEPLDIYKYFKWSKSEYELTRIGIFKRIIKPWCDNFIKWNKNLEDWLFLWPFLVDPQYGFDLTDVKVKFKALVNTKGVIADSLKDEAIPKLQEELDNARDKIKFIEAHSVDVENRLSQFAKLNSELQEEIADMRNQKLAQAKDTLDARSALDRQLRIDLLKDLVSFIEASLTSSPVDELFKMLEKLGLEMVGKPGQVVRWNSQVCESLTGEALEEGEVIHPGFTWFDGKSIVPIRRMLLKPK